MRWDEPRGGCGRRWPGAHGTAWLADGGSVTAAIPGRGAKGTYLSLGPTCRHDQSQCFWAFARWAPWAKVGSGGHWPGRGSSAAGCTWGALCRTRPPTSSRPGRGDICLEQGTHSSPPCAVLPRWLAPLPCWKVLCAVGAQKVLRRCHPHSSHLPLPLRLWGRASDRRLGEGSGSGTEQYQKLS